jgi:hypothetical protein
MIKTSLLAALVFFRRRNIRRITPTRVADPCKYCGSEAIIAAVLMRETVSVTGTEVVPGVAGLGLNMHCVFVGRPEQENETEPAKPDDPVTERS